MVVERMGGTSIPFLNDPAHWIGTYIGMGVWQNFGWGSIVYLAAIAGINSELYEAASVDGAGRFRKIETQFVQNQCKDNWCRETNQQIQQIQPYCISQCT